MTAEAVRNLEDYLENEENSQKLVTYFSKFGGTDIPDTLRRLLRSFLSKEAALQFSWKGSAGRKLAFSDLKNVNDLLLGCLMVNHSSASMQDVCNVVKRWLVGAQDRDGGRSRRRHGDHESP
ncbi:hypothetical protein MTO96_043401 [Rhipicephalus appendiculatus]